MIINSVLACAMVFSPIAVQDICLNVEKVNLAEAIIIDGEWYVALITEPIYTLSERAQLCEKISRMITAETGTKSNVIIDSGLYFDVKYAKEKTDCDNLTKRIKTYFLRRSYEYQRNITAKKIRT